MESDTADTRSPKPIISKAKVRHSNTFSASNINGLGSSIKRKKVLFVDRARNAPLTTVFNYEQVEVIAEPASPKSSSCVCLIY